jgi:DNA-binding LacI/PurR family transcriptional regulator
MGYDPTRHHAARRLVMRRMGIESLNHVVGLLVPPIFHETNFHILLFRGVMDILTPARFGLLTACVTDTTLASLPDSFIRGELDGLMVLGALEHSQSLITALHQHDGFGARPTVSLTIPLTGCSHVLFDEHAGGYQLGMHLLGLGHRYLLMHDGTDYRVAQRRVGLHAAFAEYGLDPGRCIYEYPWHVEDTVAPGERLLALLRQHPRVTGIIGPNDRDALAIARCLQSAGYRIPDDYSLAGYDDTDVLLNDHSENILTTVQVPLREAGQAATHCLLARLEGPPDTPTSTVLPVSLAVRRSTGAPRRACH